MCPGEHGFGEEREDAIPKKRVKILGVSNKKTTKLCFSNFLTTGFLATFCYKNCQTYGKLQE